MVELDELKLLERWFSILTNSCLIIIPMYDVLLLQEPRHCARGQIRNNRPSFDYAFERCCKNKGFSY